MPESRVRGCRRRATARCRSISLRRRRTYYVEESHGSLPNNSHGGHAVIDLPPHDSAVADANGAANAVPGGVTEKTLRTADQAQGWGKMTLPSGVNSGRHAAIEAAVIEASLEFNRRADSRARCPQQRDHGPQPAALDRDRLARASINRSERATHWLLGIFKKWKPAGARSPSTNG